MTQGDTSMSDQLKLNILRSHVIWGWAVYDTDFAEGIEPDLHATKEDAERHRDTHFDEDQIEFVEIFPVLMWRDSDDGERVRRITEIEASVLGPCDEGTSGDAGGCDVCGEPVAFGDAIDVAPGLVGLTESDAGGVTARVHRRCADDNTASPKRYE